MGCWNIDPSPWNTHDPRNPAGRERQTKEAGDILPVFSRSDAEMLPVAPEKHPIHALRDLATLAGISRREISLLAPEILAFLMIRAT